MEGVGQGISTETMARKVQLVGRFFAAEPFNTPATGEMQDLPFDFFLRKERASAFKKIDGKLNREPQMLTESIQFWNPQICWL